MKRKAKFPTNPARKSGPLSAAEIKKITAGLLQAERVVVRELQRRGEQVPSIDWLLEQK
jgi:hypothetical protein